MKPSVLIPILVISVIVLISLCLIIYLNRGSEKTISLFMKSIAIPMVIASSLLVYDISNPTPEDNEEVLITILHNHNYSIAPIYKVLILNDSSHHQGYQDLDEIIMGWKELFKHKNSNLPKYRENFNLDLIEVAIFYWMKKTYPGHWQLEKSRYKGINMSGAVYTRTKEAEPNPKTFLVDEIKDKLSGNILVSDGINDFFLGPIVAPSSASLNIDHREISRVIKFENRHIELTILLTKVGAGGGKGTNFGEKLAKAYPGYGSHEYFTVKFNSRYKRLLKWSPSTNLQQKWIKELMELFKSDFEWSFIREDLSKYI